VRLLPVLLLMLPAITRAQGDLVPVPSGQPVTRLDILFEDHPEAGENWLVLRFLAPQIARDLDQIDYVRAAPDMDFLCHEIGLPVAAEFTGQIDLILVALLDRKLSRGTADAAATQFMSSYRLVDGACIWE